MSFAGIDDDPGLALLHQIGSRPDDAESYLVYADLLLSRGDPRGELIVLQKEEIEAAGARRSDLRRAQFNLHSRHPELLAELAPLMETSISVRRIPAFSASPHYIGDLRFGPLSAEWYLGFVRSIRITLGDSLGVSLERVFEILEDLESTRFLRHLTIGPRVGRRVDMDPVYRILSRSRLRLTSLCVGDLGAGNPQTEHREVASICEAFPNLERLTVRGGRIRLGTLSLSELEELRIYTPLLRQEALDRISISALPKLQKLELSRNGGETTQRMLRARFGRGR